MSHRRAVSVGIVLVLGGCSHTDRDYSWFTDGGMADAAAASAGGTVSSTEAGSETGLQVQDDSGAGGWVGSDPAHGAAGMGGTGGAGGAAGGGLIGIDGSTGTGGMSATDSILGERGGTTVPGDAGADIPTDAAALASDKAALAISYANGDDATSVTQSLTLPLVGAHGSAISWSSDHSTIVSTSGIVVRPATTTAVTLTATLRKGNAIDTRVFVVTVILSDASVVVSDKGSLQITFANGDSATDVKQNLTLPVQGPNGSTVSWSSAQASIVSASGVVVRPTYTTAVTLTATVAKNAASMTQDFTIYVVGTGLQRGFLYVGGSDLEAYRINDDGSLEAVPGSPFSTSSFTAATVDPTNRFLYAIGGNGIYAYGIRPDGSLSSLNGSPVSAEDGASSLSVTPSGSYVYVTNSGSSASSISAYSPTAGGLPIPVTNSPFSTSPSSTPTSVAITPTGQYLYVCDSNGADTSDVQGYAINADGTLTKIGTAITTHIDNFHGSVAITPSGAYLYAAHAFSDNITAYTINIDGSLTELTRSPFPAHTSTAGSETEALVIAPSGAFLFTVQAWSSETACSHRINTDGSLTLVGCTSSMGTRVPYGVSMAIDKTSSYAYVPNYEGNKVAMFSIDPSSGLLTPLATAASIPAASPQALATTH